MILTNVWLADDAHLRVYEQNVRATLGLTLAGSNASLSQGSANSSDFDLLDVRSSVGGAARTLWVGTTNSANDVSFETVLHGTSSVDVTFNILNGRLTVTNGVGDVQGGVKVWEGSTFEIAGGGSEELLNLAGNGIVLGNVTVSNTLSPGLSPGTLTVTGAMTFLPTSILAFELDGTTTNVGGGINDLLVLAGANGNLTLDGTLNVTELSAFTNQGWADGDFWTLITYEGGIFNDNGLDLGTLPTLDDGLLWALDTSVSGEIRLAIVIPEPSTWALLAIGFAAVGVLSRRRRRG
jgi:hypothetical protein